MTFFFKWVVPVVIALAVVTESVTYGLRLCNEPSDLAVLGGSLLAIFGICFFVSFVMWYVSRIIRLIDAAQPQE